MENAITQKEEKSTTTYFKDCRNNWCKEDVLKLARHFHKWDKLTGQHYRVDHFILSKEDIKRLNKIKANQPIKNVKICLALQDDNVEEVTFCPFLMINDKEDLVFEFIPIVKVGLTAEYVPETFKKMIGDNWNEIDMHLIDDLFHCNDVNARVRVLHYSIGNEDETDQKIMRYINEILGNITGITLYPGVDMNKFSKRDMISFTPTLGFNAKGIKENHMGLKGVIETMSGPDETLVEYLTPCPPTCT